MANRRPVFFFAPTWDFPPGGPIRLGNVITSVRTPQRPLSSRPPPGDPGVFGTKKRSVRYTKEKLRRGRFSILAKFLSLIGIQVDWSDEETFMFETLETTQFIPTTAYLQTCVETDNVRRFLQISRYRKPVYVITGLKVVTAAQANTVQSRNVGGALAVQLDGIAWGGDGPGVDGKVGSKTGTQWEGSSDFVFAFCASKLMVSKVTGQVASEEEYRKGAMLGVEGDELKSTSLSSQLTVGDPDAEAEGFDVEELMEDENEVTCAIPRGPEMDG